MSYNLPRARTDGGCARGSNVEVKILNWSKIARDCNFRDTVHLPNPEEQHYESLSKHTNKFPATPDTDISPSEQFLIPITNLHKHNVKIP